MFKEKNISTKQIKIPITGTTGENGTLNGLGVCGFVFLKIKTAIQIITKDVNVP